MSRSSWLKNTVVLQSKWSNGDGGELNPETGKGTLLQFDCMYTWYWLRLRHDSQEGERLLLLHGTYKVRRGEWDSRQAVSTVYVYHSQSCRQHLWKWDKLICCLTRWPLCYEEVTFQCNGTSCDFQATKFKTDLSDRYEALGRFYTKAKIVSISSRTVC